MLLLLLLVSNKLFLSGLKLTGACVVHTFVDLLKVNTGMWGVYIRRCYTIILDVKLTYAVLIVATVNGAKVNLCMRRVYIRWVVWMYVYHMSVAATVATAAVQ